jgi:hypothetical protein
LVIYTILSCNCSAVECNIPIIKTYGVDSLVTSASSSATGHGPSNIMLDGPYAWTSDGGWIPTSTSDKEWIKVGHNKVISGIG